MAHTLRPGRSVVFQLLEDFCARHDLTLVAGDPYGHAGRVERPDGKRWFFKGTHFDLNPLGASEIADDKAYAAKFLQDAGLTVPRTCFVQSADIRDGAPLPAEVTAFAGETGFPLFVKPNIGQEGQGVRRVDSLEMLQRALLNLAQHHDHLLVQAEIRGRELRVIVLDGDILCAIERRPPVITGDGTRTLAELIGAQGRIDPGDERIGPELARQNLTLESVPRAGETVTLLPVTNLSAGGSARIVTEEISPDILAIAGKAAEALALRYAGVDLLLPDGEAPVVLEVNTAPGLSNLYRQGSEEAQLVSIIYEKLFQTLFCD